MNMTNHPSHCFRIKATRATGRALSALLIGLGLLLGLETAFADEFYFTRVRALADSAEGATGLFLWNDVTGAQSQIGGDGAVYLHHATDGPMAVGGIATDSAGTLYGFALDDTVTPNFLPLGTSTGSWDCPTTLRSRLVTIDTNTAEFTYVGPYLPGRAPLAASFDGTDRLWGYDCVTKEVVQIDPSSGGVIGTPIATGIMATGASGLDFAANGWGIIGFGALQFLSFDPDSGSVANVPISAQNSGFDGGLPNPYAIAGVAFTNHLAARNGSPAAEDCRLNLQEHRGIDELGHANDPFFANPVIAFKEADMLNPASVPPNWFNGGPGDIARVGGPALANCFYDWGDAPASYGTLGADNGPRHAIVAPGPYMGAGLPDFEVDGQPGPATGDDNTGTDDEDGVFIPTLTRGTTMQIELEVGGNSTDTRLQAWIDWDGDGSFAQPGDQILADATLTAGINTFNVSVPADAGVGTTYARFRIADESGLGFLGLADSGEVEDHAVLITAGEPLLSKAFADSLIPYGGSTALVFTIDNSAAGADDQSGIGFTDNLPVGLMVADPANITSDCAGAAVTADPGTGTITVSDAGVLAGQNCTISVAVTNRPGYTGVCYDPTFANENQNITGLNNLAAAIAQFTCLSVEPPDCPDADLTNGFDNVSGLSPNLNNGVSGQCVALTPTLEVIKISEEETGTFEFTLGNTDAVNPVVITTAAPGVPGNSGGVFNVLDIDQSVTVTESGLPLDWTLFEIACDDGGGDPLGSFDSATATWTAAPGELFPGQQIVCTVINLPPQYYDFGDAPASYGTLLVDDGARHLIADYDLDNFASSLMLGSRIDAEPDGFPSAAADGDDLDGNDDEDAFGVMPPININNTEYTIEVPVHNSTGADTVLVGWIDFNRNGQFDADEAATATVADGETLATLSWTGLNLSGQFGSTYARFRIAPAGEIDINSPIGEAIGGEVEDYFVQFVDLPPPFVECPVSDEPPPTDFTIQQRWETPDVVGQRTLPYQTPVVGDVYGTGQIAVVVSADNAFDMPGGVTSASAKDVHIFRGSDGVLLDTIVTPHLNWFGHASVVIADVDGDGQGEVIVKTSHKTLVGAARRGRLIAYKYDAGAGQWNELWVSSTRYDYGNDEPNTNNNRRSGHSLAVADFNGDGIPEVYIGSQIFNAQTGERLAFRPATDPAGCVLATCLQGATVAVDMDGDGQLELVAGNVVYKVDITNPNGQAGNTMAIWQQADAVPAMGDGFVSVADIDLDGTPDVVLVRSADGPNNNNTHLFVWDGQTGDVKGEIHSASGLGTLGSQPLIGDIDGDGHPEIVLVTSNQIQAYKFEPGTGLVLKWRAATNDGSGQTAFAMFDFNSNGRKELVYRDETDVRIIDGSGAAPVNLATFACSSGTRAEMPVIAALDASREARILVTCGTVDPLFRGVLRAFETASFPWANTRPVWNQQAYFVAHINDDLSVPANQFPHWTGFNDPGQQCSDGVNRPLNAFQQQVTDLDPANGCPVVCVPPIVEIDKELTGESGAIDGVAEPGEELTYTITLTNVGGADAENYSIIDQLDPNVIFLFADMGGIHDGSAMGGEVEWTGLTVPADDFIELTVTVEVVNPIPPGVTSIGNVAYDPDEGPPDCDEDPLPPNCTDTETPDTSYDFGDAPESYGTLFADDGARHVIFDYDETGFSSSLMLGARIDDELDGFPSPGADGDDNDGIDDEDAFNVMPPINISQTEYTIEVPVHNATGADAVLVGWIDFNRNGQFDPAEAMTATVADGQTLATLSWTGLNLGGQFGSTYVRLRIAPAGEIDADTPTGAAIGGEVEDYLVPFVDLPGPPFTECPVSEEPPPTDFSIQERWATAGTTTAAYQAPVVGDLYGNGRPVAVIGANDDFTGGDPVNDRLARNLHIYRGIDGQLLHTIDTPFYSWTGHAAIAIADVTGDGRGEIIFKVAGHTETMQIGGVPVVGRLIAYAYDDVADDWNVLWLSDARYDYGESRGGFSISVADFNGDGVPEVYVGNQIFNAATGERLAWATAGASAGCAIDRLHCFYGASVAADMDDDGQLELVAGNVIYKVDLGHPDPAQRLTVWQQADPTVTGVGDGYTSVADINLDGTPDVVVVHSPVPNESRMYVWSGQDDTVLGVTPAFNMPNAGNTGSQAMLGDIDGDGLPEIVFITASLLHAYKFEPGTGLVNKWSAGTNDGSGQTSVSMFDFNNSGRRELVYRDETDLRIMDGSGAAPVDLATFGCISGTGNEMPVIAALDGTREARILVTCGTTDNFHGNLRAYETASFPWANTRPVWNQQAYFVAHINDDLSVPSNQFPHWTGFNDAGQQCSDGVNRPLNAFQQQVTDLDPANGCPVICTPPTVVTSKALTNESGDIDGQAEAGELLIYTITLTNIGGIDASDWLVVDHLDDNVIFVSADMGGVHDGAAIGGTVEWDGLFVPADDFIELMVTVQVVDPLPDGVLEIHNVAYNPITEPPPDCADDPTPPNCTITPTEPDVADSKDLVAESGVIDGVAEAGEELTYEITLINFGGSDAENHVQIDQLDPNVVFVSANNGGAHDGSATGGDVTWTVTVPAADENGPGMLVLTVVVEVVAPIPDGVLAIGNVTYNPDEGPPDCDVADPPPNCSDPLPTEPQVFDSKDLVAESGAIDGVAEAGEELTYEITLVNTGGSDAENYVQIDQLDPNVIFVSADMGGVHDGAATGGPVTWNVTVPAADDFGPGVLVLTVVVQVVDPIPAGVTEIGNVTYNPDDGPPDCDVIDPPPNCSDPLPTEPQVVDSKDLVAESGMIDGIAEAGEELTYEITLINTGGTDAVNHVQIDQLDPNVVFVSADMGGVHDGSATGGEVEWVVTVPANSVLVLTVVVQVVDPIPAGVLAIGNVTYNPDDGPPDCDVIDPPPNCSDPLPTEPQVFDSKDLVAESGAVDGVAEAGEQLTYEITLINTGGTDAVNHVQIDQLDANVMFVSADMGGIHDGSAAGGEVEWVVTVPANSVLVLTVVVQVVDPIPAGVTEIGNVTYNPDDGPPDCDVADPPPNCSDPLPTEPNVADSKDLVAESGDVDGIAEAGEELTYEITLVNFGGTDAENYVQIDQLDPNVVFVSADNGGAHDGSATGGDVTWTVTVPAADENGPGMLVLTVVVQVVDPIPAGVTEIGNVTYNPDDGPPDCDVIDPPPNCSDPLPTEPQVVDSKDLVAESGNVDGIAEAGEELTYEITLTNTGGTDAEDRVQIDQLDPNVIFVSADNGGVHDGSATGGEVEWTVTVPAADENGPGMLVLTVVVQVVDPIPAGVTEIGNVTYNPDDGPPDCDVIDPPPNCSDPLPTEPQVVDSKDLVAESGNVDGIAEAGEELTYEITLTNTGGTDAEDRVQIDQLDPNVIFVSADNGGVHDGSATGGEVEWTVTVPAADENGPGVLVLTIVVQVVDPIPAGVTEIGNVTYNPDDGPPDCDVIDPPPNCSDPLPTEPQVVDSKDLVAESGDVDGIAEAGEELTYEITLTNTGGTEAEDRVQIDQLDPNVIFVSADNDGVHDGSAVGGEVEWTVTVPAADENGPGVLVLTVVVQVVDPIPAGVTEIGNVTYNPDEGPPDCDVIDPPPNCSDPLPTEPQVVDSKDLVAESGDVDGIAEAGEELTYEITLTNIGGTDAENHVQIDQLDPNVMFVSADNGGVHDGSATGGLVEWTVTVPAADENGPGVLVLTIVVQVVAPIPDGVLAIGNVTYNPDIGPPDCDVDDPPPNCTEIPTEPNTRVEKSIIAESMEMDGIAEPGEVLTYSIRVRNHGGTDAINVEVNEIVPQNTAYVANGSDVWSCADSSPAGTACDFIILVVPANGFVDLLFRVQVDDPIPPGVTEIANSVALDGEPPPQCPPDTDPACTVIPTVPQTVVSKALTGESGQIDGQVEAGEVLTYTITVTNHGGSDDKNVVVNEVAPAHTVTAVGNQNVNGALGAWSCTDGSMPGTACDLVLPVVEAGQTIELTFMIQVDDPIPAGVEQIANCVALNGEQPPNPSPQCVTLPTEPSLSVVKTLFMEDGEIDGAAEAGEILVYELVVSNSGGSTAFDEFLREIVPQYTTFIADPVSSPGWDCPDNSPNPTVCDLLFDIDAGETLSFLFAVQVVDPLPDGVTRIANAVGLGGNPPPCPPAGVHCVVVPTVNMRTDKQFVSITPFGANAYRMLYEITVSNTGGAEVEYTLFDELDYPASGVTLLDPALVETTDGVLEPGIAVAGGQFTPVNNDPVQLSDLDVGLPAGDSHTYTVAIRIAVDPDQVDNGECTGDPGNGLLNQAIAVGTIDTDDDSCVPVPSDEPRIALVKRNRLLDTNGNGYGDVGENLEYTFEIMNSGNVELSALRLIDAKIRPPQGAWVKCDAPGTPGNGSYIFDEPLPAGAGIVCTAHYTLSATDVSNRRVTNTATVVGFAPDGRQVRASHTAIFENFRDVNGGRNP